MSTFPARRSESSSSPAWGRGTDVLPRQRIRELLAEYQRTGDSLARNQAVSANLRLVVAIAKGFAGRGLSMDELISEGCVALLRAADKFDPGRGFAFTTYASCAIKNQLRQAIVCRADLIALPWNARRDLSTRRHARAAHYARHGPGDGARAREGGRGEGIWLAPGQRRPYESAVHHTAGGADTAHERAGASEALARLHSALESADPVIEAAIRARFGMGGRSATWREVADLMGTSPERARVVVGRALREIRDRLERPDPAA